MFSYYASLNGYTVLFPSFYSLTVHFKLLFSSHPIELLFYPLENDNSSFINTRLLCREPTESTSPFTECEFQLRIYFHCLVDTELSFLTFAYQNMPQFNQCVSLFKRSLRFLLLNNFKNESICCKILKICKTNVIFLYVYIQHRKQHTTFNYILNSTMLNVELTALLFSVSELSALTVLRT